MSTEKEYLKEYDISSFERPSITTDIVCFTIRTTEEENYRLDPESKLSILLIKRGEHPFKEHWALPGGFLQPNETVDVCALREVTAETNITPASLMSIGVFSEPGRDPRGWIISNAFVSIISEETIKQVGGDDASEAEWFDIQFEQDEESLYHLTLSHNDIHLKSVLRETSNSFGKVYFEIEDSGELAFDHAKIIATALTALRSEAKNYEAIFDFLPEKFTLTALQKVQETIMNISILPANFRRKIADYVVETDEYTIGAGHRPAKLYMKK